MKNLNNKVASKGDWVETIRNGEFNIISNSTCFFNGTVSTNGTVTVSDPGVGGQSFYLTVDPFGNTTQQVRYTTTTSTSASDSIILVVDEGGNLREVTEEDLAKEKLRTERQIRGRKAAVEAILNVKKQLGI